MKNYRKQPLGYRVQEVQLVYKTRVKAADRPKVKSPADAFLIMRQSWDDATIELREEFKVLFLNTVGAVIGIYTVTSGGTDLLAIDTRLIFCAALKTNAKRIILAHNHPSGEVKPSKLDLALTKRIAQAGELLSIPVTDHLIIADEEFYSLASNGDM